MRARSLALLVAGLALGLGAAPQAPKSIEVPMKAGLRCVRLLFSTGPKTPGKWSGSYKLSAGRVIAADGWRFTDEDYATLEKFQCETRLFWPRFYKRFNRDPKRLTTEPNGVVLTLEGATPESVLTVKTDQGEFDVPVGRMPLGPVQKFLGGKVRAQRVPVTRTVVTDPTEDAYPSAVAGADGSLHVVYLAFTQGEGMRQRPRITETPKDFAFLAKPTGGDRVMFTELVDGKWTRPVALTGPGDLYRTAIAADGQGRLWAFWSANTNGNWDIHACVRTGGAWSKPMRVTTAPGSDVHPAAATDSAGRVWLAWQGFGAADSDVFVARQDGDRFAKPERVGGGPGNQWTPAVAGAPDGRVAVAWDSYETGDYNVLVRVRSGDAWGRTRVAAGTLANEARPSLVFDRENRLWIAYERSPEGWGKDYGPYDQSPRKTRLYDRREVGLKVLVGETFHTTLGDVNPALPTQRRGRNKPPVVLAVGPKLGMDGRGRIWLSARVRLLRFDNNMGGGWMNHLTTYDGDTWRQVVLVGETDGFLHETPALTPAADGGLHMVSSSDGRWRAAAGFGQPRKKRKWGWRRAAGLPQPSTRKHARAIDWQIAVADTGPLPAPKAPKLEPVAEDKPVGPSEGARQEAAHVVAMRAYRAQIGGKTLRVWRGEFHRHTEVSSDGAGDGSLFDMWRYGLDMAGLDWIGNGDHDNGGGREFSWWLTQKTTDVFFLPGAFTPMFTYERSCNYPDGHRNAVFAQRGVRPLPRLRGGKGKPMDELPDDAPRPNSPDTQMFFQYLHAFGGVCASHTSATDMGTDWRDYDPEVEPIVEIYQGDRQNYERPGAPRANKADWSLGGWRPLGFISRALLKGYRLGFQSSSDHISTHMSYCNVWVEQTTREAILEAMKLRRVYGATDNIIADVRCAGHFMGEQFTVDKPPTLRVKLIGTAPFDNVVIVKDNEYVYSIRPNKRVVEFEWTDNAAQPGKASYYYVRGLQVGETSVRKVWKGKGKFVEIPVNNGEIVWVSPMWITYKP